MRVKVLVAMMALAAWALGGIPAQADGKVPTMKIINGTEIPITDAPWQVGLLNAKEADPAVAQYCGGSILSAEWIITAAHCVQGIYFIKGPDDVDVLAGEADLAKIPVPTRTNVSLIIPHPDYDSNTYSNDVALLKLASPLTLDGTTKAAIALPTEDPAVWPAKGTPAFISGWGNTSTSDTVYPDDLNGATVDVLTSPSGATCGLYQTDWYIPSQMLCAGTMVSPLTDTCQGDSGGPLAVDVSGTWTLAGITSWGEGCAQEGYPGVYTRVTSYTDWVAGAMATDWADMSGTVETVNGAVASGQLELYATCQDWQDRKPTAQTSFSGSYRFTVPAGEYRVRIYPDAGESALRSWHSAVSSCSDATVLNVPAGSSIHVLRALPGANVSGTVFNDEGRQISNGSVEFYATCTDWDTGKAAGTASFTGTYQVTVPAGEYRVRIVNRDSESGAVASWHSAKPNCQTADVVNVPTSSGQLSQTLVGLSRAPDPQPAPTVKTDQSVKKPPAKAKKGKKIALAKRTKQDQKLTWSVKTAKICKVSKTTLRTKKKGKCKIVGKAPGSETLNDFKQTFIVKVT